MKKLFILLILFSSYVNAEVKKYDVINVKDTSIGQIRIRGQVSIISSEAKSQQDRADTAKQAALDIANATGAKVLSIFLLPSEKVIGSGYQFARVNYYADGCGNSGSPKGCNGKIWEVWSSKVQLTDLQLKVAEETYSPNLPSSVLDQYGLPDEKKLQKYIAKKLKIKASDVEKNIIYLDPEQLE